MWVEVECHLSQTQSPTCLDVKIGLISPSTISTHVICLVSYFPLQRVVVCTCTILMFHFATFGTRPKTNLWITQLCACHTRKRIFSVTAETIMSTTWYLWNLVCFCLCNYFITVPTVFLVWCWIVDHPTQQLWVFCIYELHFSHKTFFYVLSLTQFFLENRIIRYLCSRKKNEGWMAPTP